MREAFELGAASLVAVILACAVGGLAWIMYGQWVGGPVAASWSVIGAHYVPQIAAWLFQRTETDES